MVGEQTRLYDTVLVRYSIKNTAATTPHTVGLRFMLDTFIGANDGVPFAIPGRPGLLDTKETFEQKDIPQYIEALEHPDPKKPGTVARVGLKLGERFEPIEKMLICRWPGNSKIRWEIEPLESMQPKPDDPNSKGDSCVVLYWGYLLMNPGDTREFAFTYGLGSISSVAGEAGGDSGTLSISLGGDFRRGKEFTATVYVGKPTVGQEVKLELPQGLSLAPGQEPVKKVTEQRDYTQLSWRVRGDALGTHKLKAVSRGAEAPTSVEIRDRSIFD